MESLAHATPAARQPSADERAALSQLEQKASNLRQSSSNNFLVALEGMMLAAIAWDSLEKPKAWVRNLSKASTAIGLAVAAIFTVSAITDRAKAAKADSKLKQFGYEEFTLPFEPVALAAAPPLAPATAIQASGLEASRIQEPAQKLEL